MTRPGLATIRTESCSRNHRGELAARHRGRPDCSEGDSDQCQRDEQLSRRIRNSCRRQGELGLVAAACDRVVVLRLLDIRPYNSIG